LSRIRLAVDNERSHQVVTPPGEEQSDRPFPWAVCFVIWAGVALAGWVAIAFAIHLI
jgi:hypothetical protein